MNQSIRAGHLRSELGTWGIFNISTIKNDLIAFFKNQVNNLFLHQSYLKKRPTPSQISSIKNAKNHFLLLKKKPKVPSSGSDDNDGNITNDNEDDDNNYVNKRNYNINDINLKISIIIITLLLIF